MVSRSHYSRQALAELVPSRDLFASLFFVSVGMLVDPALMWRRPVVLLAVLAAIMIVKPAIAAGVVRGFGYPASTAVMTGLLLAHVGELSFVLASVGAKRGFISEELYGLVLGGALISILLNPVVLRYGAPALLRRLERAPAAPAAWEGPATGLSRLSDHTVIAGCGRVGSELARQLRLHGLPYVVIELNPIRVEELRRAGEPCLFGDATNPHILRDAGIERARLLAITHYDVAASERTIKELLQHHPSLKIIARAHYPSDLQRLRSAGASEVVMPEFEAGMEFLRWTLGQLGVSAAEVEAVIERRRSEFRPGESISDPTLPEAS